MIISQTNYFQTYDTLRGMACDFVQGYYLSEP